jgi:hypothetical protein
LGISWGMSIGELGFEICTDLCSDVQIVDFFEKVEFVWNEGEGVKLRVLAVGTGLLRVANPEMGRVAKRFGTGVRHSFGWNLIDWTEGLVTWWDSISS